MARDFLIDNNVAGVNYHLAATAIISDALKDTWFCQTAGKWLESLAPTEYPRGVMGANFEATWFLSPEEHIARFVMYIGHLITGFSFLFIALFHRSFEDRRVCLRTRPKSAIVAAVFLFTSAYSKAIKDPIGCIHLLMPCYWMLVVWMAYGLWPNSVFLNMLISFRGVVIIGFTAQDFSGVTPFQMAVVVAMHFFEIVYPSYILLTTTHDLSLSPFWGTMAVLVPAFVNLYIVTPLDIYLGINGCYSLYLPQLNSKHYYGPLGNLMLIMNISAHALAILEQKLYRRLFPNSSGYMPGKNKKM